MAADAWVVEGQQILLTAETVIDEAAAKTEVGALVEVNAEQQGDGALVVRRIV